jgi:spermidine synthase
VLVVDGAPQSHVDLADPTHLAFEYVRRIGHVVDLVAEPGRPIAVVHLGAGALTVARYVAATRPGSRQRAVEVSDEVATLVREQLPLARGVKVPVQVADAREALGRLRDASADLDVLDAYAGARAAAHLTALPMYADLARVLRPAGLLAANLADGPPLDFARSQVATAGAVFANLAVMAEPAVWRRRRFGYLVLAATAGPLPVSGLVRRCAGDPVPARVEWGESLVRFAAGAKPVGDADAVGSPEPPPSVFGRR